MIKVQGFAEQGNTIVYTGGLASITKVQGSFPGCSVLVTLHGSGGTHADIFSDDADTPTPLANPFTANADGTWGFYVENVRIDITFSGENLPAPRTLYDAVTFGATGIPSYAFADLPVAKPEDAGNLARVTDLTRGPWMNTGVQWFALNGRRADITEFGGKADYSTTKTDNSAALALAVAAINAVGGGTIYFPPADDGYYFAGNPTVTACHGLIVEMSGTRVYNMDAEVPTKARLVFDGATDGLRFTGCFGLGFKGLQVDGVDVCLKPVIVDQCYLARFWDISGYRVPAAGVCYTFKSSSVIGGTGTNWALVDGGNFDHVGIGMHFDGVQPVSGSYLGKLSQIKVNFTGTTPILFEECDNTKFERCFFYRISGSGTGPWWRKSTAYQVNNITFDDITVSGNSLPVIAWQIDSGITHPGRMLGVDTSNGAFVPAIADDCYLIVETLDQNDYKGRRQPFFYRSGLITIDSGSAGTIWRDDDQLGVMTHSVTHAFAYKERMDAANFRIVRSVNPDGSGFTDYLREGGVRFQTIAGICPGTLAGAFQNGRIFMDAGVPSNLLGSNGDTYYRTDGTAAAKTLQYHKEAGVWVPSVP